MEENPKADFDALLKALQEAKTMVNGLIPKDPLIGAQLIVANGDAKAAKRTPWVPARIEDLATVTESMPVPSIHISDLVSHKDFLTALADPQLGPKNLANIWDNNIRALVSDGEDHEDPALDIAENRSDSGLATTTLEVLSDDGKKNVALHLILDMKTKKGLIVGESVPASLSEAFNKVGITYADRNSPVAEAKTEVAIAKLTLGLKPEVKGYLRDAFGYRNINLDDERPLYAQLVDRTIEQNFSKFVLKGNKPA